MNTPNKLTLLRIAFIPLFLLFLFWDNLPYHTIFAITVFLLAAITDWLDGYLARKYNQITNFGKFLDPLADKILVFAAFIPFIQLGLSPAIPVILMIGREFLVTSLRLISVDQGKVIPANVFGKIKTVTQMVSILLILLLSLIEDPNTFPFNPLLLTGALTWFNALVTVVSGLTYLWDGRDVLKDVS